jgi:hypothetical protein
MVLGVLVVGKLFLEADRVTGMVDVGAATVDTVPILGDERLNADVVLWVVDLLSEVLPAAIVAAVLVLLNIDQDLIRHAQMHERADTVLVLLQVLGLGQILGVVSENEASLGMGAQSQ